MVAGGGASGSDPALRELFGWGERPLCVRVRPRGARDGDMREDVRVLYRLGSRRGVRALRVAGVTGVGPSGVKREPSPSSSGVVGLLPLDRRRGGVDGGGTFSELMSKLWDEEGANGMGNVEACGSDAMTGRGGSIGFAEEPGARGGVSVAGPWKVRSSMLSGGSL